MKIDHSYLSHYPPPKPRKGRLAARTALFFRCVDAELVFELCSRHEQRKLMVGGAATIFSTAIVSTVAATILHVAFDVGFSVRLVLFACLVGAISACIDMTNYHSSDAQQGRDSLASTGTKLPEPRGAKLTLWGLRAVKLVMALIAGLLGGLFFLIVANFEAIENYNYSQFQANNKVGFELMARMVDTRIAREASALANKVSEVNALTRQVTALRQNDVKRTVAQSRRTNEAVAGPNAETNALETKLAEATSQRDALKSALADLEVNRNKAIEIAVSTEPHHVPRPVGLSAALIALFAITHSDLRQFWIILPLEFWSTLLEIAPLLISLSRVSSKYAQKIAMEQFLESASLGRTGAREFDSSPQAPLRDLRNNAPQSNTDEHLRGLNGSSPPRGFKRDGTPYQKRGPKPKNTQPPEGEAA